MSWQFHSKDRPSVVGCIEKRDGEQEVNGFKLVCWWWRVWGQGLSEAVRFKLGWLG